MASGNDLHENKQVPKKRVRKLQSLCKEPVGFDKTKVECFKCHKTGHFARECRTKEENRRRDGWNTGNREGRRTRNRDESITGKKEESRALVTVDGECVDWTTHSEDDDNYAFMANNSTGSDTQCEPDEFNKCLKWNVSYEILIDLLALDSIKHSECYYLDSPMTNGNLPVSSSNSIAVGSGPDMVELTSGYLGDGSRDRKGMGRNEGDDDGGILSS
ncbi:ribonuclease H-like domain-containing protein [Tanacetum coccineum]